MWPCYKFKCEFLNILSSLKAVTSTNVRKESKFITGHKVYNLAYDYILQTLTVVFGHIKNIRFLW